MPLILLMEEIQHQLLGSLSHYLQGFYISGGAGSLPSTEVHCLSPMGGLELNQGPRGPEP